MTVGILFLTACSSGGGSGPTTTDTTVHPTTTDTTVQVGPHSGRQQTP
jgi:hypothetical protein